MIVGSGIIFNRFAEYAEKNDLLIITSAHDNCLADKNDYDKELKLFTESLNKYSGKLTVYFSSCALFYPSENNPTYIEFQNQAEALIKQKAKNYLIIRVPLVIGLSQTANTLMHFLVSKIMKNEHFELWKNATRNILDVDDLFFIVDSLLRNQSFNNQTITLAHPENIHVTELVNKIELFLNKKANYSILPEGSNNSFDNQITLSISNQLKLNLRENYIEKILRKYFSHFIQSSKKISVVIPTYFEESGIKEFYRRTKNVLNQLYPRFTHELIFVNDGSTDQTLPILIGLAKTDPDLKIINFARNFGNQFAITAGIDKASGDIAVIIDDDLQDPPETMLSMIAKWEEGFDVVYAVRRRREAISFLFAQTAKIYYKLIQYLGDVKIPLDTGDFRLIDQKVIHHLRTMREENRYYRGMVSWVGFKQFGLLYDRDARFAGESKFTLKKYFRFAFDGITSFSERPLYLSSFVGLVITIISTFFACWLILSKILRPEISIRGWPSLVTIILFFGGIQLLSTGVLGLYIGKIYREVKRRPLYIIESEYNFKQKDC